MKWALSFLILLLLNLSLKSQELWGVSGFSRSGGIFKLDSANSVFKEAFEFERAYGINPEKSSFVEATNGKLYALTAGNSYSSTGGSIIELDPQTKVVRELTIFSRNRNYWPRGSIMQASDGKLYGLTYAGGQNSNSGSLFSYDLTQDSLTIWDGPPNGFSFPQGDLTEGPNNKLYFMTGTGSQTRIYEFDMTNHSISTLHSFNSNDGQYPLGGLTLDGNSLVGICRQGGANNFGTIIEYDLSSSMFSKRYDMVDSISGFGAEASLVKASNGLFYATALLGGANNDGVIFEYNSNTFTVRKVLDLDSASLGRRPNGNILQANDGHLYVLCREGGIENDGTIIKIDLVNDTVSKIHDFTLLDGQFPRGSLIQAKDGFLYGLTREGGLADLGTTFRFSIKDNRLEKITDANWYNEGYAPNSQLVQGNDGWLYGQTFNGGFHQVGTIFRINPYKEMKPTSLQFEVYPHEFQKIHDFDTINGSNGYGSLVHIKGNRLMGSTPLGGIHQGGILYVYDYVNHSYQKVYDFNENNLGKIPNGDLCYATNGKVYGTLEQGGSLNKGSIFEYDFNTKSCVNIAELDSAIGQRFDFGIMQASNGSLYAYAANGGVSNMGTIVKYDFQNNTISKVADFIGSNGNTPYGELFEATDGFMYGVCQNGGNSNDGVLFRFDPMQDTLGVIHHFTGTDGSNPSGSLIEFNGELYGVTLSGGTTNAGVAFKYNLTTNTFSVSAHSPGYAGNQPRAGLTLIDTCQKAFLSGIDQSKSVICFGDSLVIKVDSMSSLNNDSIWQLYSGGVLLDANKEGVFNLGVNPSSTFYINALGQCSGNSVLDSVQIAYLPEIRTQDSTEVCPGDNYTSANGMLFQNLRNDTNFTMTFQASNKCDSLVDFKLKVNPIDTSVTINRPSLMSNDSISTYRWLNCDSALAVIPGETSRLFVPEKDGFYAVEVTNGNCVDTSSCKEVIGIGIKERNFYDAVSISPNPSKGQFTIESVSEPIKRVRLYNLSGQLITESDELNDYIIDYNVYESIGIYFLEIENVNGLRVLKKIIKY